MTVISKYGGVTSCTADSYVCPVDMDDGGEKKSGIEEQRKGWEEKYVSEGSVAKCSFGAGFSA